MFVETVRIESLSNNSYVVGSEQSGRCVVIDPARDVDRYIKIAADHGTRIAYAFETHIHNDFVSGVRELAEQTGCQVGASASGGLLFPSVRLRENDEFDLGEFQIRVVDTPGHTPESVSFMVEVRSRPTMIFTGGALMLGGAARVDLLGAKIAPFLARWLHNTIHEKLLKLPDEVEVYPTHGGGSFCSAAAGSGGGHSTIAQERLTNPFAAEAEETSFVRYALTGLGSYPSYYKYMADINRRGPDILGGVPRMSSLTALSVRSHLDNEAVLIDARPERSFNLEHVPGSYAVPHGDNMATWIGWVVPWGQPLVLLSANASQHDDMMRQLIRIGFDRVHGFLAGGMGAWKSAGLPVETTNRLDLAHLRQAQDDLSAPMVIDVRQRREYAGDHIKGALNIELGELKDHLDGIPRDLPLITVCAAGMRATTAGSILLRDGRKNVQVVDEAGTPAWIERGYPSATGEE
ncbi:MAG: rhodanese-like domain-containing protein [Chloroflexi bacterium]|nr:rhodanese-like domain-containing protein [Chloroflexota bacterium]MDA1270061.1 rhodanese-like domain-containing protein [Chloroflexota bacterium]PKB58757.1 MAG: hypothetical protein BZY83_05425 [SAR202 cluster bacterium Casp-Chloro-G2]